MTASKFHPPCDFPDCKAYKIEQFMDAPESMSDVEKSRRRYSLMIITRCKDCNRFKRFDLFEKEE